MAKSRRKVRLRRALFLVSTIVVLSGLGVLAVENDVLGFLEYPLEDLRFRSFNPGLDPSSDVVFIDVDETSLESLSPEVGTWPWPRGTVVADHLLSYVMQGGPSVFLFDVLYGEYSPKTPGVDIPEEDWILFETSLAYPELSHAVLFTKSLQEETDALPDSASLSFAVSVDVDSQAVDFPSYNDFVFPFDPLGEFANLLHAVNYQEDADGVSRTMPLLTEYNGEYYPALTLRALEQHFGLSRYRVTERHIELYRGEELVRSVPVDNKGDLSIAFYEDYNKFETVPADVVIASSLNVRDGFDPLISPEEFAGKIVVFGGSATGLRDIKVTPMGSNVAGPYLHLNAVSNILGEQYLTRPSNVISMLITAGLVVAVAVVTILMQGRFFRFLIGAVLVVAWFVFSLLVFESAQIMVEAAPPLLASAIAYLAGLVFVGLTEARERFKIAGAMGKYLAPDVMTEVLENYDELVGEVGEEREIAILFSDIRGFTSISEQFPAETVVNILNRYLSRMIDVVFANSGTLDKMIGDAVMAFWGAPNPTEKKDYLAVKTALEMQSALDAVNAELASDGLPGLKIGIGVNTGPMIIGNIGSERRLDYTAIGDNVNLGSRIEGLTKYYKSPVLVSETTFEHTKPEFRYLFVDTVAVKGKATGIKIYRPLAEQNGRLSADLAADAGIFEEAVTLYAAADFDAADKRFSEIDKDSGLAGLAQLYHERCTVLAKNPPGKDWDGIWRMLEK